MANELSHAELLSELQKTLRDSEQRTHERIDGLSEQLGSVRTETARQAEMLTHHSIRSEERSEAISDIRHRLDEIEGPIKALSWLWRGLLGIGAFAAAFLSVTKLGDVIKWR